MNTYDGYITMFLLTLKKQIDTKMKENAKILFSSSNILALNCLWQESVNNSKYIDTMQLASSSHYQHHSVQLIERWSFIDAKNN